MCQLYEFFQQYNSLMKVLRKDSKLISILAILLH